MTILVGILCSDGVVVGADSSATCVTQQTPTVEIPISSKIAVVDDVVLVAGTGAVGLGQRFVDVVREFRESKGFLAPKRPMTACTELCKKAIENFVSTNVPMGQYGAIVAFTIGDSFHLAEFQVSDFQPELKTPDSLWFVALGSGQPIVDPLLGLMRKVFWPSGPPDLGLGIFGTMWALEHAIDVNPGGINGPPQIAVLERQAGKLRARKLSEYDLAEHRENVRGVSDHLAKYAESLKSTADVRIPAKP